jgi:hypothetical protein
MTIDDRLEKLAERHEALAESVELLRVSQAETDLRFKQVAALFAQTDSFIKMLAKITQRHEERLDKLDHGRGMSAFRTALLP